MQIRKNVLAFIKHFKIDISCLKQSFYVVLINLTLISIHLFLLDLTFLRIIETVLPIKNTAVGMVI